MWGWWGLLRNVSRLSWGMDCLAVIGGLLAAIFPDYRAFGLLAALFAGLALWFNYKHDRREQELAKPRQLSPQQQEQFLAILRETTYQSSVNSPGIAINWPVGDPEAFAFAKELETLFNDAGWDAGVIDDMTSYVPPIYGVEIEVDFRTESQQNQEAAIPEISVLDRAFNAIGMSPKINVSHTIQKPPFKRIELHIGHKPRPSD